MGTLWDWLVFQATSSVVVKSVSGAAVMSQAFKGAAVLEVAPAGGAARCSRMSDLRSAS